MWGVIKFSSILILINYFLCQREMVFASCRVCVVKYDRQAVTWAFAEFHVSLYHRFEHELLEMAFHLVVNLIGEAKA